MRVPVVITMQAVVLFGQINVMTQGGLLDSTKSIVFQAALLGYGKRGISGGSAISVVPFVIVLCVSLIQRYLTRERTDMASTSGDNHGLRLVMRYAVLCLIAAIFSFPLISMVMSSLKRPG